MAESPSSEHSSHSFATISGNSVLALKGHRLNRALSRATPEGKTEVQEVEEGQVLFFSESHLLTTCGH